MNIEQNTNHVARVTQVERQIDKKAYTHDTDPRPVFKKGEKNLEKKD